VSGDIVKNIPDLKRDNIIGDKTIYRIHPGTDQYYLSTGLGVIVIDALKYEVKDSWFIGNTGGQVKVNGFTEDANYFYAATDAGLKRALKNAINLADHTNWQLLSGTNGLSFSPCRNVMNVQGNIIAEQNDSLFVFNNNTWIFFYSDGWPLISSNVSENRVQLCERFPNGNSRVVILNTNASVFRVLAVPNVISFPRKAILFNGDPWIADQFGSLSHFLSTSFDQYIPNSPQAIASGELVVKNNIFYATSGTVNDSWNYQFNGDGIFVFKEGEWTNINRYRFSTIDSLLDYITIAIDPRDESIWAGSFGGGLVNIKNNSEFAIFKQGFIGPTIGDPSSYRVAGLAFDAENNLWISNFGSSQQLRVRKNDNSWVSFSVPFFLGENALAQIVIDDNNYKWIVSPLGNGLIVYDHGSVIDNTADDRWRKYGGGVGTGNLPSNDVLCIAKDRSGFIWVGTADGVAVIQCPENAMSSPGCDAIWPIVETGNFAGYLFKGQEVRSIAVDGADRKWVATRNGVFLISPNGEEVIYRFTEDNSPLLSNDVRKIAIDGKTGEIYFATMKGICSFRSTATEAEENNNSVIVFPNPVPPGYTGTIGIKGLPENSFVKITELNGKLVYQTRSLGGQAVWDGKNYKGQRIATGVYLILITDEGKKENAAVKLVFIG
jgi:hypothetical protein